jgi:hypothetical protein
MISIFILGKIPRLYDMKRHRLLTNSLFALILVHCLTLSVSAQNTRKNPTSKLYITETKGDSSINTGERIVMLSPKDVYSAEGTTIETKKDSTDAMVLSNGTALFVAPQTRFHVHKFLQEPFSPNRTDLEVEPSLSQLFVKITRGTLGICTSRLVAGSSMIYTTPHATINVRGRKLMIEVYENETRVSLLEGDVTIISDPRTGGEQLKPGQQAIAHRDTPDSPVKLTLRPISAEDNNLIDSNSSIACLSRRTVYFDVANRPDEDTAELLPIVITPSEPPSSITVSPTRIGNG